MNRYNIISPSLDGVISDDGLYFEGVRKPMEIYTIRDKADDSKAISTNEVEILEKYFNDIYNLFLRKLSSFASFEISTSEDTMKMQALLQELIKVKSLMNKGV